jgi:polar amino acid transport system substrate-binding protein
MKTEPRLAVSVIMHCFILATQRCLQIRHTPLLLIAICAGMVQLEALAQEVLSGPRFRHIDPAATLPAETPQGIVRLLTDKDFAPYSYVSAEGAPAGMSVELARSACAELKLACEFVPLPFGELMPALERGDGDAIISAVKLDATNIARADATKPYFMTSGRFLVPATSQLTDTSIRTLAGKRLGYVKGTSHGTFVEQNYSRSALVPFAKARELLASLKANELDAAFTDTVMGSFFLKGPTAQGCCKQLDGVYMDRDTFSQGMSFMARKDRKNLRASFDYALDRLEEKGETAKILGRYVPGSVW